VPCSKRRTSWGCLGRVCPSAKRRAIHVVRCRSHSPRSNALFYDCVSRSPAANWVRRCSISPSVTVMVLLPTSAAEKVRLCAGYKPLGVLLDPAPAAFFASQRSGKRRVRGTPSHPFSSHASSAFANRPSPASSLQVTSSSIEQGQALICRTPKAGGPARSGDLDYCARGGPDLSGPLFFPPALAVPAASSMEAASHAVTKTTGVD